MKFKHIKQHQKNISKEVSFELTSDKFNNLYLKASLGDISVSASHFAEHKNKKVQQELTRNLLSMID